MNKVLVLFGLIGFVLTGCTPTESKLSNVSLVMTTFLPEDKQNKMIYVDKDIQIIDELKSGDSSWQEAHLIPSGKYKLIAIDDNGKYYCHEKDTKILFFQKGYPYTRVHCGIFIPKNKQNQWSLWRYPNGSVAIGGMLLSTGVAKGELVKSFIIPKYKQKEIRGDM